MQSKKSGDRIHGDFWSQVESQASEGSVSIVLNAPSQAEPKIHRAVFSHDLPEATDGKTLSPIRNLEIQSQIESVEISGGAIKHLTIDPKVRTVSFESCFIYQLALESRNDLPNLSLQLDRCRVGRIVLGQHSLRSLQITNCQIHDVSCPNPSAPNPFSGSVSFHKTHFVTSRKSSKLYSGSQQFRNLRAHLESIQNQLEAGKMRALELKSELEVEHGLNKAISLYQRWVSEYGIAPGRPLLIALAIYVFTSIFLFATNNVTLGYLETSEVYSGWRGMFLEKGFWPEIRNAFSLGLQSLLNPFGIFGTRTLLVAATPLAHVATSLQGIVCDILIATSFLAIRKRFKLH